MRTRVGDWILVRGRTLDAPAREGLINFPGPDTVVGTTRPHATETPPASRP